MLEASEGSDLPGETVADLPDDGEDVDPENPDAGEVDEVTITIGDEKPEEEAHAPEWVRDLRKNHRELQRKNRELEEALKAQSAPKTIELGKKPTLEDADYDSDKFEAELTAWHERKRTIDAQSQQAKQAQENQQKEWETSLQSYARAKTELGVKDYDEAEATAQETLNVTQQGIVLQGAENPALVVYALGKNPKKAAELAQIKDPVKFAFAIAKLETQLKINKRSAPPPEKTITGNGHVPISSGKLDQLKAQAAKSGDYSAVLAYKRSMKK